MGKLFLDRQVSWHIVSHSLNPYIYEYTFERGAEQKTSLFISVTLCIVLPTKWVILIYIFPGSIVK